MLAGLRSDLLFAARSLAKARAFTFVCVVSLGIGMVPVIAIPYASRIFTTPPPGLNTDGLVELNTLPLGSVAATDRWSYPDFLALRAADTGMTLSAWVNGQSTIALDTPAGVETDSVDTMFVSANYFRTIGVTLARGPGFDEATDDAPTARAVVILGYDFWQTRLAADPLVVGTMLTLDDVPHTIVGIAPERFHEAIHAGACNEYLKTQCEQVHRRMGAHLPQRNLFRQPGRMETSLKEHQAIADAILAGDVQQADEAMQVHASRGGRDFFDVFAVMQHDEQLSDDEQEISGGRVRAVAAIGRKR